MAQRISSPLFVGRTAELAAFDRLLGRAAGGDGAALLIAGEAGIGKSRLVAELEVRVTELGALVLVGECVDLAEGELAFAPIVPGRWRLYAVLRASSRGSPAPV
jgi:hypothetical protein